MQKLGLNFNGHRLIANRLIILAYLLLAGLSFIACDDDEQRSGVVQQQGRRSAQASQPELQWQKRLGRRCRRQWNRIMYER